jgi:general secretion pathway protein G
MKNRRRGFSLIEMLLVLGIIAFIATLVVTNVVKNQRVAQRKEAIAMISKVKGYVDQYFLSTGALPSKLEDLSTAPQNVANWGGPYGKATDLLDPWKTPFTYKTPGENGAEYTLCSLGEDKAQGGTDRAEDICES